MWPLVIGSRRTRPIPASWLGDVVNLAGLIANVVHAEHRAAARTATRTPICICIATAVSMQLGRLIVPATRTPIDIYVATQIVDAVVQVATARHQSGRLEFAGVHFFRKHAQV